MDGRYIRPHRPSDGIPHKTWKSRGYPLCARAYYYDDDSLIINQENPTPKRNGGRVVKLTCNTKEIASALSAASKVVNTHTTLPILSNVLLRAEDDRVSVRATDLELTLEQWFPATVEIPGEVTVPAKLLAGFLGTLTAGSLEITGSATRVSVKAERSNYDFHALPASEFPPRADEHRGQSVSLSAKQFRDAVNAVIFAASKEEARGAVLQGTLMELEGSTLTMVATDGYRLSKWTTSLDEPYGSNVRYIVPSRALAEAARNLGAAETIEICPVSTSGSASGTGQLILSTPTTSVMVRLVDGQYPNYAQVIPAEFSRSVRVNTAGLIGGLRRAELVSRDQASTVRLELANQSLMITASSDVTGNAHEELEVEQTGDGLTVAFNARYLVEILNHIESAQTLIELDKELSPAAIRPVEANEFGNQMYILMPLRK